jgi:hypothetical protein
MPYKNEWEEDEYQRNYQAQYRLNKGAVPREKNLPAIVYYKPHVLIYHSPKLKPEIRELKEISEEVLLKLSHEGLVSFGTRWFMDGAEKRWKQVKELF